MCVSSLEPGNATYEHSKIKMNIVNEHRQTIKPSRICFKMNNNIYLSPRLMMSIVIKVKNDDSFHAKKACQNVFVDAKEFS